MTECGRVDEGLPPLPADIPFPVYGLDNEFSGQRWLDVWNRLYRQQPEWPVSHVNLGHGRPGGPHVVVITEAKLPSVRVSETTWIGPTGVADAALGAQLGMLHWGLPPDAAGNRSEQFRHEARQLGNRSQHLEAEPWQDAAVVADGTEHAVRYRTVGQAWAAATDLGPVAIGIYGFGMSLEQVRLTPANSRLARDYRHLASQM